MACAFKLCVYSKYLIYLLHDGQNEADMNSMKIHKAALCSLEKLLVKNKPLSAVIVLWQIMYEVQLVQ